MNKNKVVLVICDGLGYREEKENNAVALANTPNLDNYMKNNPTALLTASGEAIGLPVGQMGTSEANHLVIGSGRVIYQNLVKINKSVETGDLSNNKAVLEAFEHVKSNNSILHIKGMLSDGGVHGHIDHIKALIKAAKQNNINKVFLHLFTDGRDVAPKSALNYVKDLEVFIKEEGVGHIASIGGRYWGMDRDNNHDRIEKHFLVMTKGDGPKFKSVVEAIENNYKNGVNDEFIEPALIEFQEGELGCIGANDALVFTNFRSDRAKQMTKRIVDEKIDNLKLVAMTKYDDDLGITVAFPPESITHTVSDVISENSLKQLKITETEKFTHLTFFFNAQKYEGEKGEDRILIPSNKDVVTHDEKPEMKVNEIAEKIKEKMKEGEYAFIATNLTNCDMVGHTGNEKAIIKAVEYVDSALGEIVKSAKENGYDVIITADHGNAEEVSNIVSGQIDKEHSTNPVPFIVIGKTYEGQPAPTGEIHNGDLSLVPPIGMLADVAPTILIILGLPQPEEMTGQSLL